MSGLDVRVRKGPNAHYFSVFDGITPIVSGEIRGGEVAYFTPVAAEAEADLSAAVKAKCAEVDKEIGPLLSRLARRRALAASKAKTDPAPAEPKAEAPTKTTKKGGK